MVTALTATNVDATAVNTIGWLAAGEWTIVVPVYQRQYRWDIGGCEQLLADIRAVAELGDRRMHFIGSVLSAVSPGADGEELVLIDGQQRMTTLMLLVAALGHTVRDSDPELAGELERVLERPTSAGRTKLRPHRAWADVFERVVLDLPASDGPGPSRFDDNYAFFRSQISAEEAPRIWRGLQKLEHVAITLGAGANAQQIFESLNSTGEPLRDHELIHNYVLMGLSHAQQRDIEDRYWLPIEQSTGESIAAFWRQYLVMHTGREVSVTGGRGVYDVFRQEFPLLEIEELRGHAEDWRAYAAVYRVLLDPSTALDDEIARHLGYLNTFGSTVYPLVMRAYRDHETGRLSRTRLLQLLESLQSMLLRRAVVAVHNERLVARLCRAYDDGHDALVTAISRVTPSDDRVRVALKYSDLVHPHYVLARLSGIGPDAPLDVEHIAPAAPSDAWSPDGRRTWDELTEDEQNSFRAVAGTLGNLTLLEEDLAAQAFDRSFRDKAALYARSGVPATCEVGALPDWSTTRIAARSTELIARFVEVWPRTGGRVIDDDGLTPILDAVRRRGWPRGWQREWSYVEYRGEHWEVPDVKYLFNRIFKRLWADARGAVVSYSARRGGPVYTAPSWNGQWDRLDEDNHLYMGWDYSYMLAAVQGVLQEAGIESEVFVKYSYIGDAM
ncbi:DUF262 domain-containing protein [Microbacter sp. GSS18]|nr:DUF262 domain-containing protein [Microbacter sp. GSS18]